MPRSPVQQPDQPRNPFQYRALDEWDISQWQRREGESSPAFQAFSHYRDLGPRRTLLKTSEDLGKQIRLMSKWSSQHDWVARCASYDDYQAEVQRISSAEALNAAYNRIARVSLQHLAKIEMAIADENNDVPAATVSSQLKNVTEVLMTVLGHRKKIEHEFTQAEIMQIPALVFHGPDGPIDYDQLAHPSRYTEPGADGQEPDNQPAV